MRLAIVNAHPDDAEFTCPATIKQAVDLGWDVLQVLMTSDEYGTTRDEFKGSRIRRIRIKEMENAAKVYGTRPDGSPRVVLAWFGEIDGHLPFNAGVLGKLRSMLESFQPDVLVGPDSFFSLDLHPDHMHTGWLVYLAARSLDRRPLTLLYHTSKPNYFIRFTREHYPVLVDAWARHRSQSSPLWNKLLRMAKRVFYTARRIKTGSGLGEGFRRATFQPGENDITSVKHLVLHHVFASTENIEQRYFPTPAELAMRGRL